MMGDEFAGTLSRKRGFRASPLAMGSLSGVNNRGGGNGEFHQSATITKLPGYPATARLFVMNRTSKTS
jgi:hypothetical protein